MAGSRVCRLPGNVFSKCSIKALFKVRGGGGHPIVLPPICWKQTAVSELHSGKNPKTLTWSIFSNYLTSLFQLHRLYSGGRTVNGKLGRVTIVYFNVLSQHLLQGLTNSVETARVSTSIRPQIWTHDILNTNRNWWNWFLVRHVNLRVDTKASEGYDGSVFLRNVGIYL